MKTARVSLFLASLVVLLTPALRAASDVPVLNNKLYVTVDTFEPIKFNDMRHALAQEADLVLDTLKETAAASAKLAGISDEVVVLDYDEKAPKGASVLCLTWTDGRVTVTADLTENGKSYYLGVVSNESILTHPDRLRLQRAVNLAPRREDVYDATVRTTTEANLYFALKRTAERRTRLAAKS